MSKYRRAATRSKAGEERAGIDQLLMQLISEKLRARGVVLNARQRQALAQAIAGFLEQPATMLNPHKVHQIALSLPPPHVGIGSVELSLDDLDKVCETYRAPVSR